MTFTYEELYLSYNYDLLLDLVESLKEKSLYLPFLDLEFKSSDFIHMITENVNFIEMIADDEEHDDDDDEI